MSVRAISATTAFTDRIAVPCPHTKPVSASCSITWFDGVLMSLEIACPSQESRLLMPSGGPFKPHNQGASPLPEITPLRKVPHLAKYCI